MRTLNFTWECTGCGCPVIKHRPVYPEKLVKRQSHFTYEHGAIESKDDARIELTKVFEIEKKEYESLKDEIYVFISSTAKLNSVSAKEFNNTVSGQV